MSVGERQEEGEEVTGDLFSDDPGCWAILARGFHSVDAVAPTLKAHHYLGAARRGFAWSDEYGVMVWAKPTSRHLPLHWLELSRWCLKGRRNGGSMQFSVVRKELLRAFPDVTTLVSYSDPSVGHTGALYKACNWLWAPTWHRLRPPPSGNGSWGDSGMQPVKDRWVFHLRPDKGRRDILSIKDNAAEARQKAKS